MKFVFVAIVFCLLMVLPAPAQLGGGGEPVPYDPQWPEDPISDPYGIPKIPFPNLPPQPAQTCRLVIFCHDGYLNPVKNVDIAFFANWPLDFNAMPTAEKTSGEDGYIVIDFTRDPNNARFGDLVHFAYPPDYVWDSFAMYSDYTYREILIPWPENDDRISYSP